MVHSLQRILTAADETSYSSLLELLPPDLLDGEDEVEWALYKSRAFTTKSLYNFLTHRGVRVADSTNLRRAKVPPKIKIFP